jgi:hypothetical protein
MRWTGHPASHMGDKMFIKKILVRKSAMTPLKDLTLMGRQ